MAHIDTNASHHEPDGTVLYWACDWQMSRPVDVGEIVFMFDTGDGEEAPFGSWARVIRVGRTIDLLPIGDKWCYILNPSGGCTE